MCLCGKTGLILNQQKQDLAQANAAFGKAALHQLLNLINGKIKKMLPPKKQHFKYLC